MLVIMLDTNAVNTIGYNESFLNHTIKAINKKKITIFITHVQIDEIKEIPDSCEQMRSKLLVFIEKYCRRIPTDGIIFGISRFDECCFSDGKDIESIRKGKSKLTKDALIAATAKINADYLVTDDIELTKRVNMDLPDLKLLTSAEFYKLIFE